MKGLHKMEEGVVPIEIKNAAIVRRRNICLREEEKKRERDFNSKGN